MLEHLPASPKAAVSSDQSTTEPIQGELDTEKHTKGDAIMAENVGVGTDGGLAAALVAAILKGNRDCDKDGNRGEWWPLLTMMMDRHGSDRRPDFGYGGYGRGHDCCDHDRDFFHPILLNAIGDIKADVPKVALETQLSIQQNSNAIQQSLAALGIANQAGFERTGDKIANSTALVLTAVHNEADKTRDEVRRLGDKIGENFVSTLQRELAVAQGVIAEERFHRRGAESERNIVQTVRVEQEQRNTQVQLGDLGRRFDLIAAQLQRIQADNDTVNFGTMVASGNQATTSTQVH